MIHTGNTDTERSVLCEVFVGCGGRIQWCFENMPGYKFFYILKVFVIYTDLSSCFCDRCDNVQNVFDSPISLGRCGCCCIKSFRISTASITRLSFRPNSPLTFSRTPSVGGSSTSCDILIWRKEKSAVLNAIYGVRYIPLHCCTVSILTKHYSINTHEPVSRLPHLQQTPTPPIPTPTILTLCSICTQGTVLQI